jgi:hypothetical protein
MVSSRRVSTKIGIKTQTLSDLFTKHLFSSNSRSPTELSQKHSDTITHLYTKTLLTNPLDPESIALASLAQLHVVLQQFRVLQDVLQFIEKFESEQSRHQNSQNRSTSSHDDNSSYGYPYNNQYDFGTNGDDIDYTLPKEEREMSSFYSLTNHNASHSKTHNAIMNDLIKKLPTSIFLSNRSTIRLPNIYPYTFSDPPLTRQNTTIITLPQIEQLLHTCATAALSTSFMSIIDSIDNIYFDSHLSSVMKFSSPHTNQLLKSSSFKSYQELLPRPPGAEQDHVTGQRKARKRLANALLESTLKELKNSSNSPLLPLFHSQLTQNYHNTSSVFITNSPEGNVSPSDVELNQHISHYLSKDPISPNITSQADNLINTLISLRPQVDIILTPQGEKTTSVASFTGTYSVIKPQSRASHTAREEPSRPITSFGLSMSQDDDIVKEKVVGKTKNRSKSKSTRKKSRSSTMSRGKAGFFEFAFLPPIIAPHHATLAKNFLIKNTIWDVQSQNSSHPDPTTTKDLANNPQLFKSIFKPSTRAPDPISAEEKDILDRLSVDNQNFFKTYPVPASFSLNIETNSIITLLKRRPLFSNEQFDLITHVLGIKMGTLSSLHEKVSKNGQNNGKDGRNDQTGNKFGKVDPTTANTPENSNKPKMVECVNRVDTLRDSSQAHSTDIESINLPSYTKRSMRPPGPKDPIMPFVAGKLSQGKKPTQDVMKVKFQRQETVKMKVSLDEYNIEELIDKFSVDYIHNSSFPTNLEHINIFHVPTLLKKCNSWLDFLIKNIPPELFIQMEKSGEYHLQSPLSPSISSFNNVFPHGVPTYDDTYSIQTSICPNDSDEKNGKKNDFEKEMFKNAFQYTFDNFEMAETSRNRIHKQRSLAQNRITNSDQNPPQQQQQQQQTQTPQQILHNEYLSAVYPSEFISNLIPSSTPEKNPNTFPSIPPPVSKDINNLSFKTRGDLLLHVQGLPLHSVFQGLVSILQHELLHAGIFVHTPHLWTSTTEKQTQLPFPSKTMQNQRELLQLVNNRFDFATNYLPKARHNSIPDLNQANINDPCHQKSEDIDRSRGETQWQGNILPSLLKTHVSTKFWERHTDEQEPIAWSKARKTAHMSFKRHVSNLDLICDENKAKHDGKNQSSTPQQHNLPKTSISTHQDGHSLAFRLLARNLFGHNKINVAIDPPN